MPEPLRLADLDARRIVIAILTVVNERVLRDSQRLGLVVRAAKEGPDEGEARVQGLLQSEAYRVATKLAEWATSGQGQAAEIPAILRQVRADLDGIRATDASTRGPADLATLPGVALVAAAARLALVEGRTVSAVELATLASLDEHSIRAAVKTGALRPVTSGRPMRFAADLAWMYLYARGVPGFAAPPNRLG
jgi:hypothetical protein